ncbi:FAD-dependent oxidoreductase [Crocinitomix algicola]|uniref:FAD-dependent oxidoreductase n=1 Tax=Crocinitomix algicola TaxID=1740263 RepID=UPI0008343A70|nr:FAD-dependent oxidoreductase [Crocinitomix algicola]
MRNTKIAIIGAGPAGITAAYELTKAGFNVTVFEASSSVGGLSKTIPLWNQKVDLGPHRFFSDDARVNSLWLEVVGKDYRMVDRLTRIYYQNKFYHYPLRAFDALKKLGIGQATLCVGSYLKEKIFPTTKDGSFETWVIQRFGRRLYEIFFKTYSEKLWGISCQDLDEDFAAQRIKKLSLYEALKNALFSSQNPKHKTLVDQFAYPIEGTGMVYERMKSSIENANNKVYLNCPVKSVITANNKANRIELNNGETLEFDHIVSTMPITHLVENLSEVPQTVKLAAKELKFRNTTLVYLKIDGQNIFPDNWVYIHAKNLKMGRITNFSNWVPEINCAAKSTIVAVEYWSYNDDELWLASEDEIISLAKNELHQTGLIKNLSISDGHVIRLPKCYPVYKTGYKESLSKVESHLSTIHNLTVIGRYGSFKYNNQDHSILMGILAAENIISQKNHNLWKINTDYETYQEKSTITASGLNFTHANEK